MKIKSNDICLPTECRNVGPLCKFCHRKAVVNGAQSPYTYGEMFKDFYIHKPNLKPLVYALRPGSTREELRVIFQDGDVAIYNCKTKEMRKER